MLNNHQIVNEEVKIHVNDQNLDEKLDSKIHEIGPSPRFVYAKSFRLHKLGTESKMAVKALACSSTIALPFMMTGPRSQSSPVLPGGKASPVDGSTILASKFSEIRPTEPYLTVSSGPNVAEAGPVLSVKP